MWKPFLLIDYIYSLLCELSTCLKACTSVTFHRDDSFTILLISKLTHLDSRLLFLFVLDDFQTIKFLQCIGNGITNNVVQLV